KQEHLAWRRVFRVKQKNYLVSNATVRQTYDKIAESECFLRAILSMSNWMYYATLKISKTRNRS
ncbi:TPA: hypothetical protein ACLW43_002160, partial [Streptococcus pneumoniae]